jgi:hypothetical protein
MGLVVHGAVLELALDSAGLDTGLAVAGLGIGLG